MRQHRGQPKVTCGGAPPTAFGVFARTGAQRRLQFAQRQADPPRVPHQRQILAVRPTRIETAQALERRARQDQTLIAERQPEPARTPIRARSVEAHTPTQRGRRCIVEAQTKPPQRGFVASDEIAQRRERRFVRARIGVQKPQPAALRRRGARILLRSPPGRYMQRIGRRFLRVASAKTQCDCAAPACVRRIVRNGGQARSSGPTGSTIESARSGSSSMPRIGRRQPAKAPPQLLPAPAVQP